MRYKYIHFSSLQIQSSFFMFTLSLCHCKILLHHCVVPGHVYTTGAWDASEHVYTTEASGASGRVYITASGSSTAPGFVWKTEACAAPGLNYNTEASAALWHVYTVEACAATRVVYTTKQGPELHLQVLGQLHVVLLLRCLNHSNLSCRWTCLHWRGLYSRFQWFATNFAESSCFMWGQAHVRAKNENILKIFFFLQWSLSYFDVVFYEMLFLCVI